MHLFYNDAFFHAKNASSHNNKKIHHKNEYFIIDFKNM